MASCPTCGSENREGARFCDGCGGKIDLEIAEAGLQPTSTPIEDQDPAFSSSADEGDCQVDSMFTGEDGVPEAADPEPEIDVTEPEGDAPVDPADSAESTDTEEAPPAQAPTAGYLVFPDETEQPTPPPQWLIGRADVSKFLPDSVTANDVSRAHL